MSLIITRLTGGLGNQMFQFATAYALSIRRGVQLELDVTSYAHDGLRVFELSAFNLPATIATAETLARLPKKPKGIGGMIKRLTKAASADAIPIHREPHFEFDARVIELDAPHALYGYWQSERYFVDQRAAVRSAFTPREPMEPENEAVAATIKAASTPVSLHVRRGDYVTSTTASAVHGTCSLEYYRAAIASILAQAPNAHFFAFSDDAVWTRDNLGSSAPITYVASNPPTRGYRDMQLMSLCHHHIIANSSFSWWGAWLNARPDASVIAPARWFAGSDKDTRDLLPASWEKL